MILWKQLHWEEEDTGDEQDLYGCKGRRAACPLLEAQVSLRFHQSGNAQKYFRVDRGNKIRVEMGAY